MFADSECLPALMDAIEAGKAFNRKDCAAIAEMTIAEAYNAQSRAIEALGKPVGYKVALASAEAQNQFGLDEPAVGTFRASQFIASGASIPRVNRAGVTIAFEPDLLVTVGDDAINEAETLEDVAAALDSVAAFAEVPQLRDLPDDGSKATIFIATNAGAWLGVIGDTLPAGGDDFLDRLASMRVVVKDGSGSILSQNVGRQLMGHPLRPALFLIEKLRQQGKRLHPGDVISLGSFAPPLSDPSGTYVVTYEGLADNPLHVEVNFK